MVPEGWNINKLEDLATVERGKFSARPRNDPKYYGGNIPFVQTGDIAAAKTYLDSFTQTLNEEGLTVSRLFPKNTILITIAANIGDTAITTFDVACPDSLVAIQSKENTDTFWLNSYIERCKEDLDGKATQNAQKNINLQVLKPLKVLTPPYQEQKKIAQILSTWDKAISTTEALIENSQQQKKALMQQLLTGKKRFPGFEGEWEYTRLDNIANIVMGSSPKSSSYNETGEGLPLLQGNADIKNRKSCPRIFTSQVTKECSVGDILLSVRAPVGTVAISEHKACIGRGISSIKAKQKYSHEYLYQWLLSFEPKWERLSQGSTFEAVNSNDIKSLHINVPIKEEQQKIASVLTNADKEIELLEKQLADLKQEKKALMQQLLTGKRRFTVDTLSEAAS